MRVLHYLRVACRYLAEFDFRYSNRSAMGIEDGSRALIALMGFKGNRLTYRAAV